MIYLANETLSLNLKNAGFPQEPVMELPNSLEEVRGGFYYSFPTGGGCGGMAFFNQYEYQNSLAKEGWTIIKAPTLSELIEACGGDFWSLDRRPVGDLDKEFGQFGLFWRTTGFMTGKTLPMEFRTRTPEEAVAMLYISLKKGDIKI